MEWIIIFLTTVLSFAIFALGMYVIVLVLFPATKEDEELELRIRRFNQKRQERLRKKRGMYQTNYL